MLIEFERPNNGPANPLGFGEDDGLGQPVPTTYIAINPTLVGAVFESAQSPGICIIKMGDGRGMLVKGVYAEVMQKLRDNGGVTPIN